MVGMSSKTYRIGSRVRKQVHSITDDDGMTAQNLDACIAEANVYLILGSHPLIAQCLFIGPQKSYIELEFYAHGNLKAYAEQNRASIDRSQLEIWGVQMIQSVIYLHSKGVRHSDLRLDQWLLDETEQVRLSDFNASGYDEQPSLGLKKKVASGLESIGYYLPRPDDADASVVTDLFALASSLYELETNKCPYHDLEDDVVEDLLAQGDFPSTEEPIFEHRVPVRMTIVRRVCFLVSLLLMGERFLLTRFHSRLQAVVVLRCVLCAKPWRANYIISHLSVTVRAAGTCATASSAFHEASSLAIIRNASHTASMFIRPGGYLTWYIGNEPVVHFHVHLAMAKRPVSAGDQRGPKSSPSHGIKKQTTNTRKAKPREVRRSARLKAVSQFEGISKRKQQETGLSSVSRASRDQAQLGTPNTTSLKRKRGQKASCSSLPAQDSLPSKWPRTSTRHTAEEQEIEKHSSETVADPVQSWVLNKTWPPEYFEPDEQAQEELSDHDSWLEEMMAQSPIPVVQYVERNGFRYPLPVKRAPGIAPTKAIRFEPGWV
ncbi:hypothetical protein ABEF95_006793 [Exophiala dermatitidis]